METLMEKLSNITTVEKPLNKNRTGKAFKTENRDGKAFKQKPHWKSL